tara:strand:- start:4601 stop:5227 length:627 start_codon:yes stop_codon:yes gene_type:complete
MMEEVIGIWRKFISESSLSRVHRHMEQRETAVITAFRGDIQDSSKCTERADTPSEGDDNLSRNRDLKAALLSLGYGVTKAKGSYIENFNTPEAFEVSEDSMFVVNLEDDPSFVDSITTLGEKYCQDSVLIIPKGAEGAYLMGTNNSEFPGYGNKIEVGERDFGREKEFMTKVRNRPFTFGEGLETYKKLSRNERMAVKAIAKKVLKNT